MSIARFGLPRAAGVGDPMEAARAVDALNESEADQTIALAIRDATRADALTFVSRARIRAGGLPEVWTALEARMAFTIADMGSVIVGQDLTPLDPAYAPDEPMNGDAAANMAEVEQALRRKRAKKADEGQRPPVTEAP